MTTENVMPSIEEVAQKFAGKSMMSSQLTKPAPTAPVQETPPPTPEPATPEVPSENAEPTGETAEAVKEQMKEEAAAESAPEEKKDPVSAKFAALSKREKQLRDREHKAQADLKAAEDRIKQMEQRLQKQLEEAEAKTKAITEGKRPLDILKAAGFKYEDATADMLGGYQPKEPDPVDQKLQPIQQKLSKLDEVEQRLAKWEQELTQRDQQSNLNTVNTSIKHLITSSNDRYEYLNKMGDNAVDLVRDTMVEWYTTHGEMLSYEAACDRVEEYYEEELVSKLLDTKKVKERFKAPASIPPKTASSSSQQAPKNPTSSSATVPTTLTADMASAGEATIDIDKLPKKDALKILAKQLKFL
jgi:hypothetical protein